MEETNKRYKGEQVQRALTDAKHPLSMESGMKTFHPYGMYKRVSPKLWESCQLWQETPEDGQKIQWLKCREYDNQDENAGPNNKSVIILLECTDWILCLSLRKKTCLLLISLSKYAFSVDSESGF